MRRREGRSRYDAGRSCRSLVVGVLVGAAAAPGQVRGQSRTDALLHATALSYLDSQVKDAGWVAGFYASHGSGWKHLFEVGATRTGVDHLDGWRLRQTDAAAAYGRYGVDAAGRLGIHMISSNDPLSDGGLVLFGGASRYRLGRWSAGVEGALSDYGSYDGGLRVVQIAPSVGATRSDAGGRVLGATLRAYWIRPSRDLGLGARSLLSGEASLSVTAGRLSASGYAWTGEQAFAVRAGGFTVFNLAELHTGGFGGGLRWVLSERSAVSVGYYRERFQDMGLANRAWTQTLSASLGLTL